MKTRVISGIIIGVLLLLTLISGGYVTAGVLFLVSAVAYHELAGALGVRKPDEKMNALEKIGIAVVAIFYVLMVMTGGGMLFLVLSIMVLFFAEAIIFVFTYPRYNAGQIVAAVFSFVYAPVMLSFIYQLRIMPNGSFLAWIPFIAWVCDTSAYFFGRALGRHKLCPVLSPKKTVEGAVGGVFGSMIVGVIFGIVYVKKAAPDMGMTYGIIAFVIITLVASMLSQVGDLIASGIKRDHNIKDYGNLIPGHGGIMDRFDSVIFITPVIFFLTKFFI